MDDLNCKSCGNPYILPEEVEDDAQANYPQVLLCGHIFCTACLNTMVEADNCIVCPDCKVESDLPVEGVSGLAVDPRVVGLIYTTKMNKKRSSGRGRYIPSPEKVIAEEPAEQPSFDVDKIEKAVDEALAQAAEKMSQLERIHQTLLTGRKAQVTREKSRLLMEIDEDIEKAKHVISKRKDALVSEVANIEAYFVSSKKEVCLVEKMMKDLTLAMQKARQVQRCPALESDGYLNLETVLEILQTPVDVQSVDMTCITMGCGLSCVLQADQLSKCVKIHEGETKLLSEDQPPRKQEASSKKPPLHNLPHPRYRELSAPQQKADHPRRRTGREGHHGSTQSPTPRPKLSLSPQHGPADADTGGPDKFTTANKSSVWPCQNGPDVIVELILEEDDEELPRLARHEDGKVSPTALPLTGPELASNQWKTKGKKKADIMPIPVKYLPEHQLVQVIHVVNPSHFYVHYCAEKRQASVLFGKISDNCCGDRGLFSPSDTIKTGGVVFVKAWDNSGWCRAVISEMIQRSTQAMVTSCPVTQLFSIKIFLTDFGVVKRIPLAIEEGVSDESALRVVNRQFRKVEDWLHAELRHWAPQAIRCSLKDLIPADLTRGWSKETCMELRRIVLCNVMVEMKLLGHERDSLLVDLMKAPMDRASDMPISARDHLILIGLARYYTPVPSSTRHPLQYYPGNHPKVGTEYNAVVPHINTPSDFYIQLGDSMEFLLLSNKLDEFYSSLPEGGDELQLYCPVLHQACVARFNDNNWYRAMVVGHPKGRPAKVEVMFVDFGNKDIVSVSDLRKIKDEFFAVPIMAIECGLSNVLPPDGDTWLETTIQRFESLTFQKNVTVVATDEDSLHINSIGADGCAAKVSRYQPMLVTLYESSLDGPQTNLNKLLITEELACFSKNPTCTVGAKDPESCRAEEPVWDPPLEGFIASEQDSEQESGSASDQGSLRDQALDTVDFQPNLELPACLDKLKVRVTHVNSPGSFYVQLTQNNMQLKRLNEMLKQDYGSMEEPQDVQWEADMYCAVLIDGLWERGQICNTVASTNTAEVRRCDFGNRVSVHMSSLRPLQDSLVGSLALECTLSDIRPAGGRSTWTGTACDFISYYVTGATATMTVKELTEQRPVPVTLFCSSKTGPVSIADFLVREGLALKERKQREVSPVKVEDGISGPQDGGTQKDMPAVDDNITPPPPSTPASPPPSPPSTPASPTPPSTPASPTPPSPPSTPASPTPPSPPPSTPASPTPPSPPPSTPASPTPPSPPSTPASPTPPSPPPSTPASPTPPSPPPSTPASPTPPSPPPSTPASPTPPSPPSTPASPTPPTPPSTPASLSPPPPPLPSIPSSTPSPSIPVSPPLPPPLPSPAPSSPTLPVVPKPAPKPSPRTSLAAEKVKTTLYQPPELPSYGPIRISITAVGDDGVIYARTTQAAYQLDLLRYRIKQHMKTLPRQKPYTWKCVQGCSVMGPDMLWYRGQVLQIISGHVRVRYVDSGHVEDIPVVHVYPMLLCEEVPQLCIPCQLYGLIPVGRKWQVDAVALLRNLLVGRVLDMQVMELPLESRGSVTVQIILDGLNLSRIMCHHQHASVDTTVALKEERFFKSTDLSLDKWDLNTKGLEVANEPVLGPFSYPSLPEEGEHFRVRVKHLCTPNEVFLVPVEEAGPVLVNGETLEKAMARVNAAKDRLQCPTNYPLGGVCLAEYGDGRYYRARMMEFVGVNPPALMVRHVDFGSDDNVPTSKLRKMPAELLKFPASALKVRLCGFKPPRVNLETEMLSYSPEWSVKAAQVMIDLLHGKITASVMAREPELAVLLYNENGELVHLPLVNRRLADHESTIPL